MIKRLIGISLLLVAGVAVSVTPPHASASTACGKTHGASIRVEKGKITCKAARATVNAFLKADNCGTAMVAACVIGRFHCRASTPGEESAKNLVGYCYVLKQPRPAASDFSYYSPGQFKKAIALRGNP